MGQLPSAFEQDQLPDASLYPGPTAACFPQPVLPPPGVSHRSSAGEPLTHFSARLPPPSEDPSDSTTTRPRAPQIPWGSSSPPQHIPTVPDLTSVLHRGIKTTKIVTSAALALASQPLSFCQWSPPTVSFLGHSTDIC